MPHRHQPFTAETAYIIAAICLFSTGHWLGGLACVIVSIATQKIHQATRAGSEDKQDCSSKVPARAAEQCCGKMAQAQPSESLAPRE